MYVMWSTDVPDKAMVSPAILLWRGNRADFLCTREAACATRCDLAGSEGKRKVPRLALLPRRLRLGVGRARSG